MALATPTSGLEPARPARQPANGCQQQPRFLICLGSECQHLASHILSAGAAKANGLSIVGPDLSRQGLCAFWKNAGRCDRVIRGLVIVRPPTGNEGWAYSRPRPALDRQRQGRKGVLRQEHPYCFRSTATWRESLCDPLPIYTKECRLKTWLKNYDQPAPRTGSKCSRKKGVPLAAPGLHVRACGLSLRLVCI